MSGGHEAAVAADEDGHPRPLRAHARDDAPQDRDRPTHALRFARLRFSGALGLIHLAALW